MAEVEVRIVPKAKEDLEELWFYIAIEKNNPENAERFISLLGNRFIEIAESPNIGLVRNDLAEGIRQFPFKNFLIFYKIIENGIEVSRVLYGPRNLFKQF